MPLWRRDGGGAWICDDGAGHCWGKVTAGGGAAAAVLCSVDGHDGDH
eukprot:gene4718-27992_t